MYINTFAIINFFSCSVGLIGLAKGITAIVVSMFLGEKSLILNEYLNFFFHPEKRYELVAYLLGAAFLFGYYVFGYFHMTRIVKFHKTFFKHTHNYTNFYLIIICIFNLILLLLDLGQYCRHK